VIPRETAATAVTALSVGQDIPTPKKSGRGYPARAGSGQKREKLPQWVSLDPMEESEHERTYL